MRIFVAGATGVLGRRVVPLLINAGADVSAVARSADKATQLERQGAAPVTVDLFDPAAVEMAVTGHDVVMNIATRIPSGRQAFLPGAFDENSRIRSEGSQNLAAAAIAARARLFIQESFAPAYPDRGDEWIDESVPIEPAKYLASVSDAESAALEFTRSGGTGIVLRFAIFYSADSSITRDLLNAVKMGVAPYFGSDDGYVSSIHADDAARAVFAALSVPAGVYNVSDNTPMRRQEAFALLAAELGVKPPRKLPTWVGKAMGSIGETLSRSQRISNSRFRQAANWIPEVPSLRQGWKLLLHQIESGGINPRHV